MLLGQASDVELGDPVAGGHGLVEHAGPHILEDGQGPRRDRPGVLDGFGRRWLRSSGQWRRQENAGPFADEMHPLLGGAMVPGHLVRRHTGGEVIQDRPRAGRLWMRVGVRLVSHDAWSVAGGLTSVDGSCAAMCPATDGHLRRWPLDPHPVHLSLPRDTEVGADEMVGHDPDLDP